MSAPERPASKRVAASFKHREQATAPKRAATPQSQKPRKKRVRKHALTPVEREWGSIVAQGISWRRASEECGLNPSNSHRLGKSPLMVDYVAQLREKISRDDGQRVSALAKRVNRSEIIGGLVELARIPVMATRGISGQVSAYMGLARIYGMLIDRQVNMDEFFRGWTDEELLAYATTGKRPARYAAGEGQGEANLGTEPAPQV